MINLLTSFLLPKTPLLDRSHLLFTIAGKTEFYARLDDDKVQFDVVLQPDSFLMLGFGSSFANTDTVYWAANGLQDDLFAYSPDAIFPDASNAYSTTFRTLADGTVHFTSVRELESSPWNFVIPTD